MNKCEMQFDEEIFTFTIFKVFFWNKNKQKKSYQNVATNSIDCELGRSCTGLILPLVWSSNLQAKYIVNSQNTEPGWSCHWVDLVIYKQKIFLTL